MKQNEKIEVSNLPVALQQQYANRGGIMNRSCVFINPQGFFSGKKLELHKFLTKIDLTYTFWKTIRSPTQYPSATPPPANHWPNGEESKVRITNFTSSNGHDFFNMTLRDTNRTTPTRLFSSHTAPVNQTFNGIYYEDAVVGLGSFSFQSLASNLDGYEIPSDNNFPGLGPTIQMFLFSDGDEGQFDFGGVGLTGSSLMGSEIDVSISPVPIPSAVWFLASGIVWLVGFRGKKRK